MNPLTDEQLARAEASPACNIPRAMAARAARGNPWLFDDLQGVAALAYCVAASRFDPALWPTGESGWPNYAMLCVTRALRRSRAGECRRADEAVRLDSPDVPPPPCRLPPPWAAMASREEAARVLARVKEHRRRSVAWRALALGERTPDLASEYGLCRQRVSDMVAEAVSEMRGQAYAYRRSRQTTQNAARRKRAAS